MRLAVGSLTISLRRFVSLPQVRARKIWRVRIGPSEWGGDHVALAVPRMLEARGRHSELSI